MNLTELLEEVQLTKKEDVKLYFVTRASKANVTKRTPAKDKYLFNVFQMDCNDDVRSYLYETTTKQISKILQKNYDIVDYDILVELGSFNAAKEKGKVRSEGKDYVVKDGDVVLFRFNV